MQTENLRMIGADPKVAATVAVSLAFAILARLRETEALSQADLSAILMRAKADAGAFGAEVGFVTDGFFDRLLRG